jgi:hypothetical protein
MSPVSRKSASAASILLLALALALPAEDSIPAGTILPAALNSTLSSTKSKPGEPVTARIMQDVVLFAGPPIHAGTKIVGRVTDVTRAANGVPASISLRFDTLKTSSGDIPINAHLRAIASFVAVDQAQLPINGADRGTPSSAWTTVQIGGEVVFRGGGKVKGSSGTVGIPVDNGVLVRPSPNPDRGCPGEFNREAPRQSFWVFSSDACGAYSLPHVTIRRSQTDPAGVITLESSHGPVVVHSGAGILLEVDAPGASGRSVGVDK